jgi:hypothetical protein
MLEIPFRYKNTEESTKNLLKSTGRPKYGYYDYNILAEKYSNLLNSMLKYYDYRVNFFNMNAMK